MALHTIKLAKGFGAKQHQRAGVLLVRGEEKTVELTSEQVEAIKNDPAFELSKGRSQGRNASQGEGEVRSDATEAAGQDTSQTNEAEVTEPTEAPGGESAISAEPATGEGASDDTEGTTSNTPSQASTEPSVDELSRDYSRQELEQLATQSGVKNAATLPNKAAIAQAIVEKRG